MAININPQNGFDKVGHETGVTLYPYDYQQIPLTIVDTNYVVSSNGAVVTCHLKLSNDVIITGVHEQYHDKNEETFKTLAYQQAIERAESLGYLLKNEPVVPEQPEEPTPEPTEPEPDPGV